MKSKAKIVVCTTSYGEYITKCEELSLPSEEIIWGKTLKDVENEDQYTLFLLKGSDNIPEFTKSYFKRHSSKIVDSSK